MYERVDQIFRAVREERGKVCLRTGILWKKAEVGAKDTLCKSYMKKPEHFADAINYYLFGGKHVVKPESLVELDPTEIGSMIQNDANTFTQKIRGKTDMMCKGMEDWKEELLCEGKAESTIELLEELGSVSIDLKEKIMQQKDSEILRRWLKLSAKVGGIEEFINAM